MPSITSIQHLYENPSRSLANLRYRCRESWRRQTAQINSNPILVFGNQKAGTSAIAALLGEATGLSYTIDIFCLYTGLEEQILKGQHSFDKVLNLGKYYFSRDIIKDPGFTFLYDHLASRFPTARRVFIFRDPRQNIRSILNRLDLPGHLDTLSADQWQRIQRQFSGWYPVLDGNLAGHKGETYIETLALRCKKIIQIYLKYQTDVIPIYYEDFRQDKVGSINQLADRLGLPITQNIDHVKDRQFQPKGNANVSLNAFFGEKNLHVIEEICRKEMLAIGYRL
ncbi:MAG: sulfotransferase [Cyanobacteria bacterium P01_F01_bin.150]